MTTANEELLGLPHAGGVPLVLQELLDRDGSQDALRRKGAELLREVTAQFYDAYSPEIQARLEGMLERAEKRVHAVDPQVKQHATQLLERALQAGTAAKRVLWLQRAADVMGKGYGDVSACKSGCSHCCKIPVPISHGEAMVMGKALGLVPLPTAMHGGAPEPGDWAPCTFLKDDQCSIYAHRPSVCRSHLNLDQDDLLCRPVPGATVPVAYLDVTPLKTVGVAIAGNTAWADIRQWFAHVTLVDSTNG